MNDRAGRDHLGVKPGMARDLPMEHAAMAIRPVHHRSDGQSTGRKWRLVSHVRQA
jgi:hypothetical protein